MKIAWTANSRQMSGNQCTYRTNAKQGGPEIPSLEYRSQLGNWPTIGLTAH